MILNRREAIAAGAAVLVAGAAEKRQRFTGWIPPTHRPVLRRKRTLTRDLAGDGEGRQVFLWKHLETVTRGAFVPHYQRIGDCVGQAIGLGVDILAAVQAVRTGGQLWRGKTSTEIIYAGSRVEVGGGIFCPGDGSKVVWGAKWVRDFGTLLRGRYGEHDLRQYDHRLARYWGCCKRGVPDELEALTKRHRVRTTTRVESWQEAADLVANGYPVIVGSDESFQFQTDADGFIIHEPEEGGGHAWLLIGIDTKSKRPAGCLASSWGPNWLKGKQHALGTPAGCCWVDAAVIEEMIVGWGDSFAISNYDGYPRINYRL